jgi:nucleotide-binding universal stress UspA family protein
MRILIYANSSYPKINLIMFSKQFLDVENSPPTLLTIMSPNKAGRPSHNNIIAEQEQIKPVDKHYLTKNRIGQPVNQVIEEIQEGGYDLLILGDRQKKQTRPIFQISEAIRIAKKAPCPVIVVKGEAESIKRILICDSGQDTSRALSHFTAKLAEILPGEEDITILHVMSQISAGPGVIGKQLRADAEKLIKEHTPEGTVLEQDTHILEYPGIHSVPKVRHGLVVDEILDEARSGNYDLVVIGAFVNKGLERFFLDDLAKKILIQIDRPILVVR